MTQHVICRSLSVACVLVGKGGGGGGHFMRDGGERPPPQGYAGSRADGKVSENTIDTL